MYYDPYHRLHHRVIWPTYYYPVRYSFGPDVRYHYVWPYYHRKYVFISLGGWSPYDYSYMRYYWYGYHPYVWYGYYPVAREVVVGSDNYYTYNYNYYGDDGSYTSYSSDTPMDPVTQAELRARLERQKAAEPAAQTLADTRFDEGVKSFEAGNYAAAAVKFDEAMRLAPKDMILPFAYAQALFADGHYDKAADVLRVALKNVAPEKEGVFFPRGLYANDDVLFGQIDKLLDKVDQAEDDSDQQLLLGYQLLGVGETGHAREQLEQARQDPKNAESAGVLLNLVEKMEKEAGPAVKAGGAATEAPEPKAESSTEAPAISTPAQAGTTEGAEVDRASSRDISGRAETLALPTGIAPATATENKPDVQEQKSSDVAPAVDLDEPAENNDNDGGAEAVPQGDGAVTVEKAGFFDSTATAGALPGLSRLMGSDGPNSKADMAILGLILSLALAGVWIEWRVLGRKPVGF